MTDITPSDLYDAVMDTRPGSEELRDVLEQNQNLTERALWVHAHPHDALELIWLGWQMAHHFDGTRDGIIEQLVELSESAPKEGCPKLKLSSSPTTHETMSSFEKGLLATSFILFLLALLIVATGCDSGGPEESIDLAPTYLSAGVEADTSHFSFRLNGLQVAEGQVTGGLSWIVAQVGNQDVALEGTYDSSNLSFEATGEGIIVPERTFSFNCSVQSEDEMRCHIESGDGHIDAYGVYFEARR